MVFDPTQEQEIKRRRRMAEMLMQQNAPQQTQVIGGQAIPQSGLQGINNAFGSILGAYAGGTADTKEQELAQRRQELLAKAVEQWGSDPKAAAGTLMQDPSMMKEGLGIYGEAMKNDRAAMEAQNEYARKDMEWQRDADLKRELQRMRGQGGGQPVLDATGEPLLDGNGDVVYNESPRKLSATEQKSFATEADKVNSIESAQDAFNQIKSYQNKPMNSGFLAETRAAMNRVPGLELLFNDEKAANTTAYQNLIKTGQYKQLATTFPGAISNSERESLEKLGALASYTKAEQAKIISDAETGLSKLLAKSKQRAADIASGKQYEKAITGASGANAPSNDPLSAARDAIAKGAPRDAVLQRLQQNGIDATGL
jgi:hypothetical protein